ncbi:MAG: M3 family metallopeptidase [Patescibacteria group bacterium]
MTKQAFLKHGSVSAKSLAKEADLVLKKAKSAVAVLLAPKKQRTSENTLQPLNTVHQVLFEIRNKASLFAQVHPDPKVREIAEKSIERVSQFLTNLYLQRDVFEALSSVSPKNLDADAKRFLKKELFDFRLSGVDKPPAVRKKIAALTKQMVALGQTFDRNIKDGTRFIKIRPEELEGLPEDFRQSHHPDKQGLVTISTQYPDSVPFMQYAKSENARRALLMENSNRAWPKNDAVFLKLLAVRKKIANLLGYKDWAAYVTVDKMARSPQRVDTFLREIDRVTKERAKKDFALLLTIKQKDQPGAKSIMAWEGSYYDNLAMKAVVGLDTQEVRKYFTFQPTKQGILKAAERLFGLSFQPQNVKTWHKDVEVYDVYQNKKLIGRFYLDLHPRENKYNHAACFEIQQGITNTQLPEAALICNFSRGLLDHSEVVTFLHEFGHLMHFILAGKQKWIRFSGFATEWDFVEAPSQMLESWAFDYETLKTFARHTETGEVIPEELVEKLKKSDNFGKGIWQRRQLFLTTLSLEYHRRTIKTNNDLLKVVKELQKKYSAFAYVPGTHSYASFGHLNGYSAIYYTYLWSRAIAEDILGPFEKKGMYNREVARRYRELILARGGSEDAEDLLKDFLGRKWNLARFRRWLEK